MNEKENISLKHYIDKRFEDFKNYMDTQFDSVKQSTHLAQENIDTRLESMNEFRNSMKDQASRFITRTEYDIVCNKYDSDIRNMRETQAENRGKASQQSVYIAYLIALVGIIVAIGGIILKS